MEDIMMANSYFPSLIVKSGLIIEVHPNFPELAGYSQDELTGRDVTEVFKLLRILPEFNFEGPDSKRDYFLFSKDLEYRNVRIILEKMQDEYIRYIFHEISNSRFEEKFIGIHKLLEDGLYGIAIYTSPDLNLIKANQAYLNILDMPYNAREMAIGSSINRFINWSEMGSARNIFQQIISKGTTFYGKEIKGITGSWKNNYCNNTIIPVTEEGRVKYIISMVEDVTERVAARKRNEEQAKIIENQNQAFDAIIENISDGLYTVDENRDVELLNDSVKELFYKSDSIKTLEDLLSGTKYYDSKGVLITPGNSPSSKIMKGEKISEYTVTAKRPDGTYYFSLSGSPICDKSGKIVKALFCIRDVTRREKGKNLVRQTLERQAEMLYQIINNIDLPLLRVSYPELRIVDINQKAYNMIKSKSHEITSRNEIINNKLTDRFDNMLTESNMQYIVKCVNDRKVKYINNMEYTFDGGEIYSKVILQPVVSVNGGIEEILMVFIDITSEVNANKAMEKILNQQEEFFANISHELKTPLNVIYSTAQLFNLYAGSDSLDKNKAAVKRYINTVIRNCDRLSKLINNIVDLSKIEAGYYEINKANHNIVYVVEDIVLSIVEYANSKGIDIIFDTDVEEKIIACDPEKIERILLNLLSNAIKFTGAGGEILVQISDKDKNVEISVKDNGTGIDKSQLEKIFDRFKQADKSLSRNAEGTGIGLSLVKAIVKLHGGKIKVDSELGKGSQFTVILPVEEIYDVKQDTNIGVVNLNNRSINIEFSDIY